MQRYQQITGVFDLILPILLYFVWGWDLHFILLFAYIDTFSGVIVSFFKERKIQKYKLIKKDDASKNLLIYLFFGFVGLVFYEISIQNIYPKLDLWSSFVDFLLFEEMGIPQFAIVIPLVLLLNYQQYNVMFIRSESYRFTPLNFLQQKNRNTWLFWMISAALFFGMSTFFKFSPIYFLFVMLVLKALIDFVVLPYLDKRFVSQFVNLPNDFSR